MAKENITKLETENAENTNQNEVTVVKKESRIKRAGKWIGNKFHKWGDSIKESPVAHVATAGVSAIATYAGVKYLESKFNGSDDYDEQEPIETEFSEEEYPDDIRPTEDTDDEAV